MLEPGSSVDLSRDPGLRGRAPEDRRVRPGDQRRNPVYLDPEAARALGYPDVIAPPTFAIVMTCPPAGRYPMTLTWVSTIPGSCTASSGLSMFAPSRRATGCRSW